ncbi:uncharacterized protein EV422DRAFT_495801, partial [Fimicolochytrium jonesii]|uniref:uncharacterized protein n=1 Tax=Fimicolochytrium jonesii TaxID=1396493 RepID=UPI0022FF1D4D
LDISSRNLSHFPALPAQFNGLVELHLVNNWITAIPGSILGRLERLQVLDLSQNLLAQLPAEIGGLRELREVYVRENRLVGLPVELADAGRLRVCDFGRNRITDIGNVCYPLHSLQGKTGETDANIP